MFIHLPSDQSQIRRLHHIHLPLVLGGPGSKPSSAVDPAMSLLIGFVNQIGDVVRSHASLLSISFGEAIVAKRAFNINSTIRLRYFGVNPSPEARGVEHVLTRSNADLNTCLEGIHADGAVLYLVLLHYFIILIVLLLFDNLS